MIPNTSNKQEMKIMYNEEEISNIVGKKGRNIKELKRMLNINIKIVGNIVEIRDLGKLNMYETISIIDALALGFSAKKAVQLQDPNYLFERINLKTRLRKTRRKVIKSRIIGKEGKTIDIIQKMTGCDIKIFDNTVGIIGKEENVELAKRAIEKLMRGAPHSVVYKWLAHESEKLEDTIELTKKQLAEMVEIE